MCYNYNVKKERTPDGARSCLYKGGGQAWRRARKAIRFTTKQPGSGRGRKRCGATAACAATAWIAFARAMGVKPRRAVVVHHIQPIEERPDLALTLSNLRSLCEACHNRRHPEKGGKNGGKQAKPAARMRVIKI